MKKLSAIILILASFMLGVMCGKNRRGGTADPVLACPSLKHAACCALVVKYPMLTPYGSGWGGLENSKFYNAASGTYGKIGCRQKMGGNLKSNCPCTVTRDLCMQDDAQYCFKLLDYYPGLRSCTNSWGGLPYYRNNINKYSKEEYSDRGCRWVLGFMDHWTYHQCKALPQGQAQPGNQESGNKGACNPNPCKDGAKCWAGSQGSEAKCECPGGKMVAPGQSCNDPCSPNPCPSGAKCWKSGETAKCECPDGQTVSPGQNCKSDPCKPNPCPAFAMTCGESRSGKAMCKCGNKNEWIWPNGKCTTNPCKPNPCPAFATRCAQSSRKLAICKCGNTGKWIYPNGECKPNPCKPNPCPGGRKCAPDSANDQQALCKCPAGTKPSWTYPDGECKEPCEDYCDENGTERAKRKCGMAQKNFCNEDIWGGCDGDWATYQKDNCPKKCGVCY